MASIVTRGSSVSVTYYYYSKREKKRKKKWESGFTPEAAELRKKEIEYLIEKGEFIAPDETTVEELAWEWLETVAVQKKYAPETYTGYEASIKNHILPHLGSRPVQSVTAKDIDQLFITLARTQRGTYVNGVRVKPQQEEVSLEQRDFLSSSTLRDIYFAVDGIFKMAVKYEMITKSPVQCEIPKKADKESAYWTDDLVKAALEKLQDETLLHLIVHCIFYGSLRSGEAVGITLDCIDLNKKQVLINKTLQRTKKESLKKVPPDSIIKIFPNIGWKKDSNSCLILKTPKTTKSKRIMFLSDPLMLEIQNRIKHIQQSKELLGKEYHDHGLLLCLPNGDPIEPKLVLKWFKKWQKRSGLCFPELPVHGLRHSATQYKLEVSGGDIKAVQGENGHSTAKMVTDVYAHVSDERRKVLHDKMNADFYTRKKEAERKNEEFFFNMLKSMMANSDAQGVFLQSILQNPEMQKTLLTALFASPQR